MKETELLQLKHLLTKFSNVYKNQYPLSAGDCADDIINTIDYIREGDEDI